MRSSTALALLLSSCVLPCHAQVVIARDANGDLNYINSGPGSTFDQSGLTIDVRRFATIPNTPGTTRAPRLNSLTSAPGVDGLFVVDAGLFGSADTPAPIYRVSPDGTSVTEFFDPSDVLDLPRDVPMLNQQGGVRSLAFHPEFSSPGAAGYGKLYTSQVVARPSDVSGLSYLGPSLTTETASVAEGVVAEWDATFDLDGNLTGVDLGSYRELFRVATPLLRGRSGQHGMKQIAFNPHAAPGSADYGNLYVLQSDGADHPSIGTGQNGGEALGKVLRINPLQAGADAYSVPADNPFVSDGSVLDEIFTLGHRNIHTIAFTKDSEGQTRIFATEIGHASVEEVNLLEAGSNYGWGPASGFFFEGTFERPGNFTRQDADVLPHDTDVSDFAFPVAQYGHNLSSDTSLQVGIAIAGGYGINNGSALDGYYFLSDFSNNEKPVWAFEIDDALDAVTTGNTDDLTQTPLLTVDVVFDHDDDPLTQSIAFESDGPFGATLFDIIVADSGDPNLDRTDIRFGQGAGGELYIINKRNGMIYQVSNSIAPLILGDLNGDGQLTNGDISAFVQALTDPAGYASTFPDLDPDTLGDFTGDGLLTNGDITGFVDALTGGGSSSPVPEPSSLALLGLGAWVLHRRRSA